MNAPLLSPDFTYVPSADHQDVAAFAARQRARQEAAQQQARKARTPHQVAVMTIEADEAGVRG